MGGRWAKIEFANAKINADKDIQRVGEFLGSTAKTSALFGDCGLSFSHPYAPGLSHSCRSLSEPPRPRFD